LARLPEEANFSPGQPLLASNESQKKTIVRRDSSRRPLFGGRFWENEPPWDRNLRNKRLAYYAMGADSVILAKEDMSHK
jgi:hypothetical protein